MRSDYKLKGQTVKVEIEIEKEVAEVIKAMEDHSKFSRSEITNTALKRYISQHKDFLPANYPIKF
jgi:metal-responsive CopG/Arc/MetJ family transcriptional regulator